MINGWEREWERERERASCDESESEAEVSDTYFIGKSDTGSVDSTAFDKFLIANSASLVS